MNIELIKQRIEETSRHFDKRERECTEEQNQDLQAFIIWLKGYLDGLETKTQ